MYYALIKNSKVENVIVADDSFIELIKADWDEIIKVENYETSGVGPGTAYIDSKFMVSKPESVPE